MAKPDFEIDIKSAVNDLRKEFSEFRPYKFNRAVARAINHTVAKSRTKTSRDIRSLYKVKSKELKQALSTPKATAISLSGALKAIGRPLPIFAFGARQTKKGVTANIMGARKLIRGAFIATMTNGHKGVFARGKYNGYSFAFRDKRVKKTGNDTPINELTTSSVPKMMENTTILNEVIKGMETQFTPRLAHELAFMRSQSQPNILQSARDND